ncbi:MAG: class I adenylate-forming enzyme family protein [Acidimicrobiales bacterium]
MPDLVAIDLPAGPAWVAAAQAAWDRGDAVAPLDQRLGGRGRAAVLDALAPAVVVGPGGPRRRAGGVPTEEGDALVVATSGTSGAAKGVVLTHDAVAASARATTARLGVDPGRHRWLACLPLSHVGGLSVVTRALLTGTALTVLPRFEAGAVLANAGPEVMVSLVPTALTRVGAAPFHTVVLGGSAPPAPLPGNVVTTYGLTETGSGVVYDGVPLAGVEVGVDPGTAEIRLRGPMLLRAYRDGSVPLDAGGWLPTGDAGRLGAGGCLVVDGRLSDLIVTGGENVWPAAVEAVLGRHPSVATVAVAGLPDPEWGERVVAWVVPRPGAPAPTLDGLRALVGDELAPYAAPRQLVLVSSLPTTPSGKVRRSGLGRGAGPGR